MENEKNQGAKKVEQKRRKGKLKKDYRHYGYTWTPYIQGNT
jgi:hypothetical protein